MGGSGTLRQNAQRRPLSRELNEIREAMEQWKGGVFQAEGTADAKAVK